MPNRDNLWIALLAVLVLAQMWVSLAMKRGEALTIANDSIQGILLLVAAAAFLPNTFRSHSPLRRTRNFWILMTAGMLFWLIYQGMWNYFEVLKHEDVPDPFAGDVVLFLHLVPMMAALALLPHLRDDERDPRVRTLDFALLLTWWVFLYVYAVIPWQTVHIDELIYSGNFNSVYLTEKLVLLVALAILAYGARGGWGQLYGQLLGASALYASSSYVANWAISHERYYSGSVYDIPLSMSIAWMAAIASCSRRFNLAESKRPQPLLGMWITRLGMIALFSLPWFALHSQMEAGIPDPVKNFRAILTLLTMIVMGTMVFWRQTLLGEELSMLLERSHRSYEDLKKVQAQLIQSEKLASLGRLVGGAAHEINNPLTAMLGYSELLSASTLPPLEKRLATRIAEQVRRIKTLLASLLTFARPVPARMSGVDMNSVLQTALRLLAPQLEATGITIHRESAPTVPHVLADSNQLLHVCVHLAGQIGSRPNHDSNAVLYVRTHVDRDRVLVDFNRQPPSAETNFHPVIFDGGEKSASLSLSACCRIVEEHSGRILSQISSDECTAFRLDLPAVVGASDHASLSTSSRAATSNP